MICVFLGASGSWGEPHNPREGCWTMIELEEWAECKMQTEAPAARIGLRCARERSQSCGSPSQSLPSSSSAVAP